MNHNQLVDTATAPGFDTHVLQTKQLVVVPSQGEPGTHILVGSPSEMLYEHRQEGEAMGRRGNIFVARCPLPPAEQDYRQHLFGAARPIWLTPACVEPSTSLDRIVANDPHLRAQIAEHAIGGMCLYGFNQTPEMQAIADSLGMPYYGNPEFAAWAGGKIGLAQFAEECGLYTPHTDPIYDSSELVELATGLKEIGYQSLVIKVNHSTGGMGHKVSKIDDILARELPASAFLPSEFDPQEGAAVQGWIVGGRSMGISSFVDHDGRAFFTGATAHKIGGAEGVNNLGSGPIEAADLEVLVKVGGPLLQGYLAHQAYGAHNMGMVMPPPEVAVKLGFPVGVPLCNDENTRPGGSTISKAWILAIREGLYGIGWTVSKIKVPEGTKIADVIAALDEKHLLLKRIGRDARGIFVWNGNVLDYGEESAFFALAISGNDDPGEAQQLLAAATELFEKGAHGNDRY